MPRLQLTTCSRYRFPARKPENTQLSVAADTFWRSTSSPTACGTQHSTCHRHTQLDHWPWDRRQTSILPGGARSCSLQHLGLERPLPRQCCTVTGYSCQHGHPRVARRMRERRSWLKWWLDYWLQLDLQREQRRVLMGKTLFTLYSGIVPMANLFNDFGETGSHFVETIFPGFPSYVL